MELVNKRNALLAKSDITEEDTLEINRLNLELDEAYLDLAKGAYTRSRAKWLEEGERNSRYFFALEKRNGQRIDIDGVISEDQRVISDFVAKFYGGLYTSNFNYNISEEFID